ncbi:MAG TPA: tRNA dihydrouridine synthase DusB [Sedimenticola thiotaurini]|uniref:tRNA-dihydrouridine synthase B n=1 Tax=Sedimenticola thiotaurini TaxID=1543721 RepID=A0A831RKR4_9GAMM|nr:tRNA dihydrouridine synthase DusB [Sedimenticola thiotaurini]
MRIGPHALENNLLLAPMAGVTDRPFRQLCRELGAGMAVSEMVASNTALHATRKTVRRLDFAGEAGPVAVQIVGADPATMAEAARANVAHGADIIDINMGCPAKKVCRVAAGSALLRDENLVRHILAAVVDAVDVPVTLKIRTGWDPASRNGVAIARIAEEQGIQAIAVHGRTRACGYAGNAEYDTIRRIKQAVTIPVIANGDIDGPHKARQVLEQTGADGLMIGRAARGRPWLFRQIGHYLETGRVAAEPAPAWIGRLVQRHVRELHRFYGEYQGLRIARKHIGWYSRGLPGGNGFRQTINRTDSAEQQLLLIGRFFAKLGETREMAA